MAQLPRLSTLQNRVNSNLPAMLITAVLLWRKNLLGFLLAGPLLVFSVLMGTAILSIFLVMGSQEVATSVGIEAFFGVIIVVSLVLSVLYIREVNGEIQ